MGFILRDTRKLPVDETMLYSSLTCTNILQENYYADILDYRLSLLLISVWCSSARGLYHECSEHLNCPRQGLPQKGALVPVKGEKPIHKVQLVPRFGRGKAEP